MLLKNLVEDLKIEEIRGDPQLEVKDIAYNSKKVRKDSLFVAIKGIKTDGHKFIKEAIQLGARAVVLEDFWEKKEKSSPKVTIIKVKDSREALASLSNRFYGYPSRDLRMIGITGTNGKTTVSFLLESILKEGGGHPGVIGTINYRFGGRILEAFHTTPEALELQKTLREMVDDSVKDVIMEVSSHALEQKRVDGCEFKAVIFTNFTPEHLDFHHSLDNYFKSKQRLFSHFLKDKEKIAVINSDDPRAELLITHAPARILRYGIKNKAEIRAEGIKVGEVGLSFRIDTPQGGLEINSPLKGEFNIYNILAAATTAMGLGISFNQIKKGIEKVRLVPGRLEEVEEGQDFTVLIDYAHTSDALERVLKTIKGFCCGRIITVFGCGGDRDRSKRPKMGEISATYSDLTLVTSDNPRSEDPLKIMAEIERGIKLLRVKKYQLEELSSEPEKKGYILIASRKKAIERAIFLAKPKDIILIAGKGHEDYQILGDKKIPFDDREEARTAIRKRRDSIH